VETGPLEREMPRGHGMSATDDQRETIEKKIVRKGTIRNAGEKKMGQIKSATVKIIAHKEGLLHRITSLVGYTGG
jgi:hypothetical protein